MRVTIGIPCFGQSEFLPEAIESAMAQTHQDLEIIVVNDGSLDNTQEVAERYFVKVIRQANKGLASARNTAIMNMTGDLFLPLDADDKLLPNAVEVIVSFAEKHADADVIAPSIRTFGLAEQDVILMPNPDFASFKDGNRLPYCSAIRKNTLLSTGGYSPRMEEGWEDLHLWYDILSRGGKIVTIPTPLVLYRTKKESMWTEARDKHSDKLWKQIMKDFPQTVSHAKI